MRVDAVVEIMKGFTTIVRYSDPWYKPSGCRVSKDGSTVHFFKNIKLIRKSDVIEHYGLNPKDAMSDWYLCLAFPNSVHLESDVYVAKGKRSAYAYPLHTLRMSVDGQPVVPANLNLMTTEEIKVRSAKLNPSTGRIELVVDALMVAHQENYDLLSKFYIRRMENRLRDMAVFEEWSPEVWTEKEEYTVPLAKALGQMMFMVMRGAKVLNRKSFVDIAHAEYKTLLNAATIKGSENPADSLDAMYSSHVETMSETPEEKAKRERFEREIMEAEAELRGLGVEELKAVMDMEARVKA